MGEEPITAAEYRARVRKETTEAELQGQVVGRLRAEGYRVLQTTERSGRFGSSEGE
jgi:hypothetical protein